MFLVRFKVLTIRFKASKLFHFLVRLQGLEKDDSGNSKWRKDREHSEQELRTITQDLRTMLVRVEEEIVWALIGLFFCFYW